MIFETLFWILISLTIITVLMFRSNRDVVNAFGTIGFAFVGVVGWLIIGVEYPVKTKDISIIGRVVLGENIAVVEKNGKIVYIIEKINEFNKVVHNQDVKLIEEIGYNMYGFETEKKIKLILDN